MCNKHDKSTPLTFKIISTDIKLTLVCYSCVNNLCYANEILIRLRLRLGKIELYTVQLLRKFSKYYGQRKEILLKNDSLNF